MAVGAQQIERRLRDAGARQFRIVDGIGGNRVDAQQIAEAERASAGAGWPITIRLKCVSSSFWNRSSTGPSAAQLEPQPREAIAALRRVVGQARPAICDSGLLR